MTYARIERLHCGLLLELTTLRSVRRGTGAYQKLHTEASTSGHVRLYVGMNTINFGHMNTTEATRSWFRNGQYI